MEIKVSTGELLDKWTILRLKAEKIDDQDKLRNVQYELDYLNQKVQQIYLTLDHDISVELDILINNLFGVNRQLWEVEDKLRALERLNDFGDNFVDLARVVYKFNDERASLKKFINRLTNSEFTEEKSYTNYS